MQPIKYLVVGEEDYAFMITIDRNGEFDISGGTYASDRPRHGKLTPDQEEELLATIRELGIPDEHPMPEGAADAFEAQLVVGDGTKRLNDTKEPLARLYPQIGADAGEAVTAP